MQPRRIEYVGRARLSVPDGYVLIRAASPRPGQVTNRFYVLKDRPALTGADITNPQPGKDPNTRVPNVTFDFTPRGVTAFQSVTAAVARRGSEVSRLGETLNQHFAVALDNTLITVPFIDFKQYPDGITGDRGADISGDFTARSAKDVAILLRYGPLPVHLTATG